MRCRLCGKHVNEIGGWLERVNEKGVDGIWECRPMCGADLPQDERVMGAIEGPSSAREEDTSGPRQDFERDIYERCDREDAREEGK